MKTCEVGQLVKFKAEFLRSTCWYTDVPINGKVVAMAGSPVGLSAIVTVEWSDGHTNRVNAGNLMLYSDLG